MENELAKVLSDALSLSPEARAALAGSLLDSLDQEVDPDAESAWREEIRRRIKAIDAGVVELVPWDKARRKIFES